MGSLSRLEALSLFGNEISALPSEIFEEGKLAKLARLPLSDNKLKGLPKGWATRGGLEGLQELWLSRNDIEALEFLDDEGGGGGGGERRNPVLPSLTRLWIDGNSKLDAEKVIRDASRACPALQEVHADCARCRGGGRGACTRRRADGWRCTATVAAADAAAAPAAPE